MLNSLLIFSVYVMMWSHIKLFHCLQLEFSKKIMFINLFILPKYYSQFDKKFDLFKLSLYLDCFSALEINNACQVTNLCMAGHNYFV